MASGAGSIESGEPEFQVAPMIDVLLVLLVFFMSITSAQVEQLDKTITLPVAPDAKTRKIEPNQRTVNIRWNATEGKALMTYLGQPWEDREALSEELQKVAKTLPTASGDGTRLEILLRADAKTPAKEVQSALQVVAQSTPKVIFATHNK
jgi:biopolymer transport protein ExbD